MILDIKRKAYLMLFITAFGWALSTILIKMFIAEIPVFHLMFGRFFIALIFVAAFNHKKISKISFKVYKIGSLLGLMLFLAYTFAILSLQHTSASKSGFLVALSVLFVPIVQLFIKRKMPNRWTTFSVASSVVGLFLISGMNGGGFNYGDFIAILCAVAYTVYIMLLDKYAKTIDDTELVLVQLGFVTILSFVFSIFFEGIEPSIFVTGFWPIFATAIFGTALAIFFQAKAQKHASPESVGLILLGEPLLTLLMAVFILGEAVMLKGLVGAFIILISLVITVVKEV